MKMPGLFLHNLSLVDLLQFKLKSQTIDHTHIWMETIINFI